ncbi:MAG: hypothetical protein KUG56_00455 [Kordiimonadaceae bacterium]|nr:hypothetical protein [Kordiimonadaceae bacterium]
MLPSPIPAVTTEALRSFQLNQLKNTLASGKPKLFSHELMQRMAQHTTSSQSSLLISHTCRPVIFCPILPDMAASCAQGTTTKRTAKSKNKARQGSGGSTPLAKLR